MCSQPDFMRQADAVCPVPADPSIAHALDLIDTSRIDQTIKPLVGFDNRNSLSSMERMPPDKGVEAAAYWIEAEFERISKGCVCRGATTEWREDYNHQHQNVVHPWAGSSDPAFGDLPEFVDFNYVAKVARLNAAVLATLAASLGPPPKVAIDTQTLQSGTTLTGNRLLLM